MQNGEKGFEPVWCPFYREDSGRSIYCEGITDESFLRLTFASGPVSYTHLPAHERYADD